jgi:hypothetical protein
METFNKYFCESEKNECIICYSTGKSSNEDLHDIFLKRQSLNYPIISLATAFNCKCTNTYAHNKCLVKINRCPTCRKIIEKPNLYVKTNYDYMFGLMFAIIKKNPNVINIIQTFCAILVILSIGLFLMIENNWIVVTNDWKWKISFAILIFIQFVASFIFIMQDYFTKFWLYNSKSNKFEAI